jgi:MFS family permease
MLYPVMPIYLKSIGFSIVLIGVLEGFVEALAGLSKGYFGRRSDRSGKRLPFVQLGYGLSAISKPLMAAFVFPVWIFFVRSIDRLGKGIRTGARDAMLSDESAHETKGKIFGFHRAMDTLGAVIGPAAALLYLQWYPGQYKMLFLIAFIPGLLALAISFLLKESKRTIKAKKSTASFFSFLSYWKESTIEYRKVIAGLLVFALFNSSDVFLLLKIKEEGFGDAVVITIYIFYNLIYALFSFPVGMMADKIGLRITFIGGLFLFAVTYFGMGLASGKYLFFLLFMLYGIYAASTEGIAKAWISNIAKREDTATAIGFYTGFQSVCALLASSISGLIWYTLGAKVTFIITAVITILVMCYFLLFFKKSEKTAHTTMQP